jgi:hypothetical protein
MGKDDTYKGLTQCKNNLVNNMCPDHGTHIYYNKKAIVAMIKKKLDLVENVRGEKGNVL